MLFLFIVTIYIVTDLVLNKNDTPPININGDAWYL